MPNVRQRYKHASAYGRVAEITSPGGTATDVSGPAISVGSACAATHRGPPRRSTVEVNPPCPVSGYAESPLHCHRNTKLKSCAQRPLSLRSEEISPAAMRSVTSARDIAKPV